MSDDLPAVVEETALAPILHDTLAAAYDDDLVDRCVDLKVQGIVKWNAIHRRLNAMIEDPEEHYPPEAVQACLHSKAFERRLQEARQDPAGWLQMRLRRVQQMHRMIDGVEVLASKTNKDKRTRTANLQHRLAIGGVSPQTQVAVGPDQNFMGFITKMMTKRSDAPQRD